MTKNHTLKERLKAIRPNTIEDISKNRAHVIIDTPVELAAVKALRSDPVDTPEEIKEEIENQRTFGPG
jgi:hypothetical protein